MSSHYPVILQKWLHMSHSLSMIYEGTSSSQRNNLPLQFRYNEYFFTSYTKCTSSFWWIVRGTTYVFRHNSVWATCTLTNVPSLLWHIPCMGVGAVIHKRMEKERQNISHRWKGHHTQSREYIISEA
jgi:hypothetical protein